MNVDYSLIGARIKSRRREVRMTQEMLAEKLSVSVGYVSQVERGVTKISLDLLANISGILNCDVAYFVSGSATGESGYLKNEITEKYDRMSPRQRKMLLEIVNVILGADE